MKFIPLDAVLAEINRLIAELVEKGEDTMFEQGRISAFEDSKLFLDTLEAKEVDLDFILHEYWDISPKICVDCLESATMTKDEMINFAKHFFELGLKAQKGE